MLKNHKFLRRTLYIIAIVLGLFVILGVYLVIVSKTNPPKPNDLSSLQLNRVDHGNDFYTLGNDWFRKSNSGLFELYVEGAPFERGVINGKLTRELVQRQEDHFNEQINKMIL